MSRAREFLTLSGRWVIEGRRALADGSIWRPQLFPQMLKLGVQSIPVALFVAVFTGIVLALLSSYMFTRAIPLYFVGTLVTKAVMLELGPVLTGMALAGRVGANVAAELGTMRVTEQVDALETLAISPHAYLVTPRVIAATLMFPVVTAMAMAVGVLSGWFTAVNLLDLSSVEFIPRRAAVLQLQGHLVRAGQERQLRRRHRHHGLLCRARRAGRGGRRRSRHHPGRGARLPGDPGAGCLLGAGAALTP